MWVPRPTSALLAVLVLACAAARADDVRKAAEEPDLGFLEFLGSVDRLSDVVPPIANKYREGKMKRTLKRELKST